MTELKPCPFCGKTPKWTYVSNSYGTGASGMEAPDIGLSCCGRNMRGRTHEGDNPYLISVEDETKERLAAEWNKRAPGD